MTPAEFAAFTTQFPAFDALTPSNKTLMVDRTIVARLPQGATYLHEGDGCSALALVLDGSIRVSKTSATGRSISLFDIVPGETCILSASCLLTGANYPATAVATDAVRAALIPAAVFQQLFDTTPSVRTFVLQHFTDRLATTMALVEEVAFHRVDQRAARWLSTAGLEDGIVAMSHEEVADHLGTARVVVSRVLADFERRGWVTLGRRRIEVLNRSALGAHGNQSD